MRWLTAIPVYNEARHVQAVLNQVRRVSSDILVIDDGSTDETPTILSREPGLRVITHRPNRGYGAAIASAFQAFLDSHFDVLVTMDCDGQHEPSRIPVLLEAMHNADIVSGSRYLRDFRQDSPAPADRRSINATITREINARYGLKLTDAFCGFKAYRRCAIEALRITEAGWGMPLQLWVQAAHLGLRVNEVAVPRLYLDPKRAFGGVLNDPRAAIGLLSPNTPRIRASGCSARMSDFPSGVGSRARDRPLSRPGGRRRTCSSNRRRIVWAISSLPMQLDSTFDPRIRISGIPLIEFRRAAVAGSLRPGTELHRHAIALSADAVYSSPAISPSFSIPASGSRTFVLNRFARQHGGIPLNLVVDNDSMHTPAVRVPLLSESPRACSLHSRSNTTDPDMSFHTRNTQSPTAASSIRFPERLADKTRAWKHETMAFSVWPRLQRELDRGANFGESVSRVRRAIEQALGHSQSGIAG